MAQKAAMRQLSQLLIFLAFAVQAWIPAGFMPDSQSGTMVICSGIDQAAVKVDSSGHPLSPSHEKEKCPYATLAFSGFIPASSVVDLPVYNLISVDLPVETVIAERAILSAHPRGPPSIFS